MRFIDLFAGVGGFRLGMERAGHECVWSCEIDRWCQAVYRYRFGEMPTGDIRQVDPNTIPDHDCLCAGFPCQSFSVAGRRGGFGDARGTLFHEICRIARAKKPPLLLLENVAGLLSAEDRTAFAVVLKSLGELGYDVEWQVLNSKDFGVPQNRERVYLVGHLGGIRGREVFPVIGGGGEYDEVAREAEARGQGVGNQVASALRGGDKWEQVVSTIDSNYHKGRGGGRTLVAEDFYRGRPTRTYEENAPSLRRGRHGLKVIDTQGRKGKAPVPKEICPTLRSEAHGNLPMIYQHPLDIAEGKPVILKKHRKDEIRNHGDICPTLTESHQHYGGANPPLVVRGEPFMIHNVYGGFGEKEPRVFGEHSPTIRTPKGGGHLPHVVEPMIVDTKKVGEPRFYDIAPTLQSNDYKEPLKVAEAEPMVKESRNGKFRVHRNDEKKSEIQGYSFFDPKKSGIMDVVDAHPKNIIVEGKPMIYRHPLNYGKRSVYSPSEVHPSLRTVSRSPKILSKVGKGQEYRLHEDECTTLRGMARHNNVPMVLDDTEIGIRPKLKGTVPTLRGNSHGNLAKVAVPVPLKFLGRNQRNYDPDVMLTVDTCNTTGVAIVADRTRTYANLGRNLKSPKSYSNALSGVQKDNLVFLRGIGEPKYIKDGKKRSRNYSLGKRIYDSGGLASSLTAKSKGGQAGHTGIYKVGNIYPSGGEAGEVVDAGGIYPTVKQGKRGGKAGMPSVAVQLVGDRGNPSVSVKNHAFCVPSNPMSDRQQAVISNMRIRRLTPRECERLQAFPDDWTRWGLDENGKLITISDCQRYKMMGNAVTVLVVEFIARRLRL